MRHQPTDALTSRSEPGHIEDERLFAALHEFLRTRRRERSGHEPHLDLDSRRSNNRRDAGPERDPRVLRAEPLRQGAALVVVEGITEDSPGVSTHQERDWR